MENIEKIIYWLIESAWLTLKTLYIPLGSVNISYAAIFIAGIVVSLIVIVLRGSGFSSRGGNRGGNRKKKAMEEED